MIDKNLYLIDGHACCYKYYFGYEKNPLRNSRGDNTSVCYGMARLLTSLFLGFDVSHLAVIFDPPNGTWRKRVYPEYKATRTKSVDIRPYIGQAYEMIRAWQIYTSAFKDFEADDIIALLTKKAVKAGFDVSIITKDKDYAQLVNEHVRLIDINHSVGKDKEAVTVIDREAVKQKWGVYPEQISDYLSLVGDASDNIKGVPGIGEKTAALLLNKYSTAENVYTNIKDLSEKQQAKFVSGRDSFLLAKRLVTMPEEADIKLPLNMDDLKIPEKLNGTILNVLLDLEFKSIIDQLR